MNITRILNEFAAKVRCEYPNARIWLFGSQAQKTANEESDLDVCIVLPNAYTAERLAVSDMAWEIGLKHDLHISTVVISEKDFELGPVSVSPLVEAIRSEGIAA